MTELKPCPFCGSAAHVVEIQTGHAVSSYTVSCNAIGKCIASDPMRYYPSEGQAVNAWNERADGPLEDELILEDGRIVGLF